MGAAISGNEYTEEHYKEHMNEIFKKELKEKLI